MGFQSLQFELFEKTLSVFLLSYQLSLCFDKNTFGGNHTIWFCFTDVSRMRKPRDNCYIEVSRAGSLSPLCKCFLMEDATMLCFYLSGQ